MATRKTPKRNAKGRFVKKSGIGSARKRSSRKKATRKTSSRRTSTTRKKTSRPRRRKSGGSKKLTPTSFIKGLFRSLKKDGLVYLLALSLMAIGFYARPNTQKVVAGKPSTDWMGWAIRFVPILAGSFLFGKFMPKQFSREQITNAATLAALGVGFYGVMRPMLMKLPGYAQTIGKLEGLGTKLNEATNKKSGTAGYHGPHRLTQTARPAGIGDGRAANQAHRPFARAA